MNHVYNFLLKIFGVISDDVKVLQDVIKILENFRKQSRILPDVRLVDSSLLLVTRLTWVPGRNCMKYSPLPTPARSSPQPLIQFLAEPFVFITMIYRFSAKRAFDELTVPEPALY